LKKIKCPECEETFSIELDEYDDGDYLACPECNLELVVVLSATGRLSVKPAKEVDLENGYDEFYSE